ncbi:hypothetical protein EMA8858_03611 [Emticicia aquatica]|uniref:Anti-sigma factor n=1 Tax=Emticicia aquatica TaxID=1681835 RepID=A0ABM9AUX4_9BACT|nr:hypothetical protein [Emticicia aquatica]CAH0997478.1 hypothetical protein EMA8858_03611 [Emticicia aquatica]
MQADEFYKHIQQKIDHTDFEPDWNKRDVWQRIEQKQGKQKTPFIWWTSMAASIVVLGGVGFYFFNQNLTEKTDNQAINNSKNTISTQPNVSKATKSTQENNKEKSFPQSIIVQRILAENTVPITEEIEKPLDTTVFSEQKEVVNLAEEATSKVEPTFSESTVTFVANPNLLEKKIPQKRERIAILEIPDDEEGYNLPKKEKKGGFLARFTKKLNKFGAEPTEELPSINNKPNKVWAFVKESFKNETMTADSTDK